MKSSVMRLLINCISVAIGLVTAPTIGFAVAVPTSALYSDVVTNSGVQSSVSDSSTVSYTNGPLHSYASTSFGVNRAYAQATGPGAVGANSVWYDSFSYNGAAGPTATVNYSVVLTGSNLRGAGAGGLGGGEYDLVRYQSHNSVSTLLSWIEVPDNASHLSLLGPSAALLGFANLDSPGNYDLLFSGSFSIAAGETWYIASILSAGADTDQTLDYAHSAHFGISTTNGAVIDAASGNQYPTSVSTVPEPATLTLSLVALGVLGMRRSARMG